LGAFAANFHPKDACRYLLHLANLRGGHDNITVMIARIGPWVEPKGDDEVARATGDHAENGKKGGWMKGIASGLLGTKKKASAAAGEEHVYRSSECPISEELVDRLAEQVRVAQQTAIDQTWPVEWTKLAGLRRKAEKLRNDGRLRAALKDLGESIEMLGLAGLIGSGRTELARVLFGLTPADSGAILLDGEPIVVDSPGLTVAF